MSTEAPQTLFFDELPPSTPIPLREEVRLLDRRRSDRSPELPQEQPVQTITVEPATLWQRTGAYLTDFFCVTALSFGMLTLAMAVIASKQLTLAQQIATIAKPGLALTALLSFVYTTVFAALWGGRTPGRRLLRIHLVDQSGHSPGALRALARSFLSILSFALFLSGFWLALFDRHRQTLHDKLTRTFVVKTEGI